MGNHSLGPFNVWNGSGSASGSGSLACSVASRIILSSCRTSRSNPHWILSGLVIPIDRS